MKRFAITLFALLCTLSSAALAQKTGIDEGIEYQRVSPPQPTETGNKIEVLELFWYGCPHCYHFEPLLKKWLETKPANVEFRRMPAIFTNPRWELDARAFYTAKVLGVLYKIHSPLFDAIHAQKRDLNTEAAMRAFFVEHGVKGEDFDHTFHSFYVQNQVNHAKIMTERYGTGGVPTIIVNGKYRVDATASGSMENMLRVVNFLIDKESREKGTGEKGTGESGAK